MYSVCLFSYLSSRFRTEIEHFLINFNRRFVRVWAQFETSINPIKQTSKQMHLLHNYLCKLELLSFSSFCFFRRNRENRREDILKWYIFRQINEGIFSQNKIVLRFYLKFLLLFNDAGDDGSIWFECEISFFLFFASILGWTFFFLK